MQYSKLIGLTITLLLIGLATLVACGPSAPSRSPLVQAFPTETSRPTMTPLIQTHPTETPQPTMTPLPPGYIKPTDLPTYTPFPTLPPDPTYPTYTPTPPGPSLTEQVAEFVRDEAGNYDAVAKVKVLSKNEITVPKTNWPKNQDPHWGEHTWLRTKLELVNVFHGEMPDDVEIATPSIWPNTALEANQEYILFLHQTFVGVNDFPGDHTRFHFNEKQLRAFGGPGAIYFGAQSWIIDGDLARRVPVEHLQEMTASSGLAAAQRGGGALSVRGLVDTILDAIEE